MTTTTPSVPHLRVLIQRWVRSLHRTGRRPSGDLRPARPRSQPLYEALAIGLGCDSFDHEMPSLPEWR